MNYMTIKYVIKEKLKMNEVYVIGKIISKIEYKFITSKKHNAIARFEIMLENESIIKAIAYDNVADKVLRKCHNGDLIFINGKLNSNSEIIIIYINNQKLN